MRIQPITNYRQPNLITFKSNKKPVENFPLTKQHGIDANNVKVIASDDIKITPEEKAVLIEKVLEANLLAKKNYNYGNIAKAGYATNVGLENGIWHLATNFNNTRNDISAICGERNAIVGAYNDLLKSKPLVQENAKELDFKVKYMAMSSYKDAGTDTNAASSCAECLSWFNTPRYFSDDTIIASLSKQKDGQFNLKLSTLKEYLPYRCKINTAQNVQVKDLPIKLTEKALASAKSKNITEEDIRKIVETLKYNYDTRDFTSLSNQDIQAAVLSNGELFTATKVDFSKRWHVDAIQFAAAKAIEKYGNDTEIDLIAVFGDSIVHDSNGLIHPDGILNMKTLGALNTKFADSDALVVTNTDKAIHIRTISDYMPNKFKFIQGYNIK